MQGDQKTWQANLDRPAPLEGLCNQRKPERPHELAGL